MRRLYIAEKPSVAMITRALCALLIAASAPHALAQPLPDPPPPVSSREGLTFGLSIGLGFGSSSKSLHFGDPHVGLAGVNLELGGFFSPTFGVVFKSTGVTTVGDVLVTRGIWAIAAQVWATDIFKIEAGPGLHYMAGVGASGAGFDTAFGLYLAPAIQLEELDGGHSLQAGIEASNGFYEGGSAQTIALVFAWQSL